jgi:hypothetical protein
MCWKGNPGYFCTLQRSYPHLARNSFCSLFSFILYRLLISAAFAYESMWYGPGAKRLGHTTYSTHCAAPPRVCCERITISLVENVEKLSTENVEKSLLLACFVDIVEKLSTGNVDKSKVYIGSVENVEKLSTENVENRRMS